MERGRKNHNEGNWILKAGGEEACYQGLRKMLPPSFQRVQHRGHQGRSNGSLNRREGNSAGAAASKQGDPIRGPPTGREEEEPLKGKEEKGVFDGRKTFNKTNSKRRLVPIQRMEIDEEKKVPLGSRPTKFMSAVIIKEVS